MTATKGNSGASMASVRHIVEETSQAINALRTGDKHMIEAAEQADAFKAVALGAGDLLHQATMLATPGYEEEARLVSNARSGVDSYSSAAGILLGLSFESVNPALGAATEASAYAVESMNSQVDGARALALLSAMRAAANKITEAEMAIAQVVDLAGQITVELRDGQNSSQCAQQQLETYLNDIA